MKRKSVILSLVIMALCIVVGIVGVTAAWFGDIKVRTSTVVITSFAPQGNATMSIDSTSDFTSGAGKLMPAIIKRDIMITDGAGANHYDDIDVLDSALVGTTLEAVATQMTMEFDFMYGGTPEADDFKSIQITLASVTLQNPRTYISIEEYRATHGGSNPQPTHRYEYDSLNDKYTQSNTGDWVRIVLELDDYKDEFNFTLDLAQYQEVDFNNYDSTATYYERTGIGNSGFTLCSPQPTIDNFNPSSPSYTNKTYYKPASWYSWSKTQLNEYQLYILAKPYEEARFSFTVNFARVDEETSPYLINAEIFFNFEIDSVGRIA